ncbi:alpha/beta fold hydrolase [Yinghuangia seranimata]|uniref:alpha/beta fold hydrolase n=1 Tax=Yinghuangia seranimata TaxID=408067 RepID=UPI00248BCB5B|nr:alpha/beta fold hydrolase [Yinghuangia seranimata]MDI2126580.1 alpha/beta fold hydrolase [Yinghuangia seranimata]
MTVHHTGRPAHATPREERLTGARGQVHVRVWSPADAEPAAVVLFLHGLGEYAGLYGPLAEHLTADGVELWAPDHIGHGLSDGTRVLVESVDAVADDAELVLARIAAERPGVPLVIAGHSLGSAVSLLLAAERPAAAHARALVLAGASVGMGDPDAGPKGGLRALLDEHGIDPMDLRKDPSELCGDAAYAEQVRNDPLVWDGGLRYETLDALEAAGRRIADAVASGRVTLPVLFLHGGADDLAPAAAVEATAARLPDARARVFPEDRHNVLAETDRADVYAEFGAFVRTHTTD